MAGLLLLVRRRPRAATAAALIDALILTVGLALPSWIALIAPYLHDDDLSTLAKLVSIAYPLGDILLLAAAIRLAVDAGRREPAFYLLTASIVALLVTDFVYGLLTLQRHLRPPGLARRRLDRLLPALGRGGLHPSMARLEQPVSHGETSCSRRFRLALLTCASLIAPVDQDRARHPARGDST